LSRSEISVPTRLVPNTAAQYSAGRKRGARTWAVTAAANKAKKRPAVAK
jgi:hypothetical protein